VRGAGPLGSTELDVSTTSYDGGAVVVVRFVGEWDLLVDSTAATRYLASATTPRTRHVVVDLAGLTFMGSYALYCLLSAKQNRDGVHGALHVTGVDGNRLIARVIDLTGLREVFDVRPDLDALLAVLGVTA
jgi:anti-sigma B factor antagonist